MTRVIGGARAPSDGGGRILASAGRVAWIAFVAVWACAGPDDGQRLGGAGAGSTTSTGGNAGESPAGTAGEGSADSGPTFCEALEVIERKCQRCHVEPPEHGAPFALVTYDDTQVVNRSGVPRYERMLAAVESDFMPATFIELEPPVEPLDDDEKALLVDWLSRGAEPVGGTDCSSPGR
jgi:hypothetical protein